jgi:predicted nucleotidyltransferase
LAGSKPRLSVFARLKERAERDFSEFVERVKRAYSQASIILFGSRARGDHLPYSDWDLAVVIECRDESDRMRIAEELYRLKPPALPLDAIVVCVGELDDPIVSRMLAGGRLLYDGARVGRRVRGLCRSAPEASCSSESL